MEEDGQREQLKLQENEGLSLCPSFSSYTTDRLADIAAKVGEEFSGDAEELAADGPSVSHDDDFEFSFVRSDADLTAEIFHRGGIRRFFPIFNRDLLIPGYRETQEGQVSSNASTLRLPLKKLFLEDREERDPPSSSSSEVDELEAIPPETYCVWRPKVVGESPSRCKKSKSTGSASKRWKLRGLLGRSNSDVKSAFVFLTPKRKEQKAEKVERAEISDQRRNSVDAAWKAKAKGVAAGGGDGWEKVSSPAHDMFHSRNRTMKEGDKRRSYLPYRQDLVGFFANVNGIGRSFPPF